MTGALLKKVKEIERKGVKHSSKINEVLDDDREKRYQREDKENLRGFAQVR
jgi:hypothetical protein